MLIHIQTVSNSPLQNAVGLAAIDLELFHVDRNRDWGFRRGSDV